MSFRLVLPLLIAVSLLSCKKHFLPKPEGYPRQILPKHTYQNLPDTFPYFFEYSRHAKLKNDTSWISEPYWVNLEYPQLGGTVQITYKIIDQDSLLEDYLMDSYKLTDLHKIKAYSIEESVLHMGEGATASILDLQGEVPSPFQFHTTDSTLNFLRGVLYFPIATKNDSLAPSIKFIRRDMIHLLRTLRWKNLKGGGEGTH